MIFKNFHTKHRHKIVEKHYSGPSKPICIDCGAHAGLVSDIILRCGGVVHSFEPNTFLFHLLESKYQNNPNVFLHNAALSHQNGETKFYFDSNISQSSHIESASDSLKKEDFPHYYVVKTIDLCEYITTLLQKHKRIYLLKIDIKGAEFDIMHKLLESNLHKHIDYIACETHERYFTDGDKKLQDLHKAIKKHQAHNVLLDWI